MDEILTPQTRYKELIDKATKLAQIQGGVSATPEPLTADTIVSAFMYCVSQGYELSDALKLIYYGNLETHTYSVINETFHISIRKAQFDAIKELVMTRKSITEQNLLR